jgi:hypothetical protein
MEPGKSKRPFTWERGPRVQDHAAMNARILNNLFARFHYNEEKTIAWAKRHALLEWDRLQVDLQYTPEVPNSRTCEVASF